MAILVTGSTGSIGSQVLAHLAGQGAEIHALVRAPDKAHLPAGVTAVQGDMTDIDSMRAALSKASTLFLLNAVVPDEVTQALITLNLAREAGIQRIVYFSVIHSDLYTNVPHFAGKFTVERMIEQLDLPATILRPAYFIQNDLRLKDAILGAGIYPMPIGNIGLSMVDTTDIGATAAHYLLKHENAPTPLPRETLNVVGPNQLTGTDIATIWSEVLNRPIKYAGDDVVGFERQMRAYAPGWMAYDMRLMLSRFQTDGMIAERNDVPRLEGVLGRKLHSYREFAVEAAKSWKV